MYITASEPNSTVYSINPSSQSVCVCVCVYRQRLSKRFTASENTQYTRNNRRNAGRVIFYAVRVRSKKNRLLVPSRICLNIVDPVVKGEFLISPE
jgi:hypothetical protein